MKICIISDDQLIVLGVLGALHSNVDLESKQRHGARSVYAVRSVGLLVKSQELCNAQMYHSAQDW